MTIPGYTLTAPVCENGDLLIYRATRLLDGLPVLLKSPASPRPMPVLLRQLEREYELALDLDSSRITRPNGSKARVISSVAELFRDDQGKPLKVVGVIQDITELKRAEEALHLQTAELEEEVAERQMAQESQQEKAFLLEEEIEKRQKTQKELEQLNEKLELHVKERTTELEDKNAELYRMNRLFVGRELKMMELKERIKELEGGKRSDDRKH